MTKVAKQVEKKQGNASKNKAALKVVKTTKVTHLKEGVTGKQLMQLRSKSNTAHKTDLGTFSQCLKRAKEFDSGFITSMNLNKRDLSPTNLLKFASEGEGKRHAKQLVKLGYVRYSVWEVQGLIKRMAKAKVQ